MLNETPEDFTLVQIHIGDAYATTWGNGRKNFYGVSATPTAWFDGLLQCVGAYSTVGQTYNWYKGKYNTRKPIATDIKIEMSGRLVSGTTYEVTAVVSREPSGSTTPKPMRIQMVQLLDYWPAVGGYHRNGVKQGATYQDVSLLPGQSAQVVRSFTFDADSWNNKNNIKIITFAQNPVGSAPAEVYQAASMQWPFPDACRQGRVDLAVSGPAASPVLLVNGSTGNLHHRKMTIAPTDPFAISLTAPPSGPATAPFVLYVWLGEQVGATITPHPKGLGSTCFPTPLTGGTPQPKKIWNNIGKYPLLGTPNYPSSPAPSTVLSKASGIGTSALFTLQGFILDNGSAANQPASITNAVTVNVQ